MAGLLLVASLAGGGAGHGPDRRDRIAGEHHDHHDGPERARRSSSPTAPPLAPANAPRSVRKAIAAANKIHTRPYIWGGGHRSFKSRGYDCSGAVSYVLHAAGMLRSPMASGPLMSWGSPGIGQWITVYANTTHAWMTVAGLRFDTSAAGESLNQGSGPRWRVNMRAGDRLRHTLLPRPLAAERGRPEAISPPLGAPCRLPRAARRAASRSQGRRKRRRPPLRSFSCRSAHPGRRIQRSCV